MSLRRVKGARSQLIPEVAGSLRAVIQGLINDILTPPPSRQRSL